MTLIKILIVEDSAFMRKLINELLSDDRDIRVVGTARNGADALKKIEELKPDVITMDIEMPVMDGLTALRTIMEKFPTPVVMLSSTSSRGKTLTMQSMQLGAVDFIEKPSGAISLDLYKVRKELIFKVKQAAKANLGAFQFMEDFMKTTSNQPVKYSKIFLDKEKDEKQKKAYLLKGKKIIGIGTSTGGPRALHTVIPNLPLGLKAPILIVQHMPKGFTKSLADRLNALSLLTVKEAADNELIMEDTVYIAPGGKHLGVIETEHGLRTKLSETPLCNGHRPSVDVLFHSLAELSDTYTRIAVVMTGMGSDGSMGVKTLKQIEGSRVIAESEESCVVYGMPKAAISTNLVDKIIPVQYIADEITNLCRS